MSSRPPRGLPCGRLATAAAQGAEQRAEDVARAGTAGTALAASAEETAEQAAEIVTRHGHAFRE